jgi:hypothetical protein
VQHKHNLREEQSEQLLLPGCRYRRSGLQRLFRAERQLWMRILQLGSRRTSVTNIVKDGLGRRRRVGMHCHSEPPPCRTFVLTVCL